MFVLMTGRLRNNRLAVSMLRDFVLLDWKGDMFMVEMTLDGWMFGWIDG